LWFWATGPAIENDGLFNPVSNKQKSKYCSLFRDDVFECRLTQKYYMYKTKRINALMMAHL